MATRLLAISGPLRKSEFAVGPEFAIGRDAGNSVRLEDPTVSPHHCRIEIREGQLVLSDLGSRCGTFVNGIPVKERVLRPGDEVAVGSSVFVVQVEETASAGNNVAQKREREALDAKALEFQGRELLSLDLESPPKGFAPRLRQEQRPRSDLWIYI